ncbi:MAG TPA: YdcF family protein [Terriglobales bacterium]|nr:YdcF family protein [Terriglobales bacterium]
MGYTFINIEDPHATRKKRSYWRLWLAAIFVVLVLCLLHWGGYLLVAPESLPNHVDAAVVLQGSVSSEKARIAAAMALLQRSSAGRVALSVPKESLWGEQVVPVARQYLEKNYGAELAGKVDFCETATDVDSTEQEAQELSLCIQEHRWKTIALVTSNYHSRRAGMIWRKTLPRRDPSIQLAVDGVAGPEYQPRGWWRQRLYARIWFTEASKLLWAIV